MELSLEIYKIFRRKDTSVKIDFYDFDPNMIPPREGLKLPELSAYLAKKINQRTGQKTLNDDAFMMGWVYDFNTYKENTI